MALGLSCIGDAASSLPIVCFPSKVSLPLTTPRKIMTPQERLARINAELAADDQMPPLDSLGISIDAVAAASTEKKYQLLADGDSWFDYPLGKDVLDYLNNFFKHPACRFSYTATTTRGPMDEERWPSGLSDRGSRKAFEKRAFPSREAAIRIWADGARS
jgi:hypothetical protein